MSAASGPGFPAWCTRRRAGWDSSSSASRRALGLRCTAPSAEDDKRIARERGAQAVFLSDPGGFVAPLLELTDGAGVDVVFDSVGKPTLRHDFKVTRKKGLVVNFGESGGAVDDLNPAELGEAGSLYLTRPRLKDHLSDADTVQARATDLYAGLAAGTLSLPLGRRYAMEQIGQAHADVEERKTGGKPLLDIAVELA